MLRRVEEVTLPLRFLSLLTHVLVTLTFIFDMVTAGRVACRSLSPWRTSARCHARGRAKPGAQAERFQ